MTSHDDAHRHAREAVARYFEERGVSDGVRSKGLRGIIADWDAIAHSAAEYDLTLDDWMNDLDLRDIIAGAMLVAPEHERHELRHVLDRADRAFRAATRESVQSPSASAEGLAHRHDPVTQWWYFRYPANPGETMRADIAAAGVTLRS